MKGIPERAVASKHLSTSPSDSESSEINLSKTSPLSGLFSSAISFLETYRETTACEKKANYGRNTGWTATVKRIVSASSMRRLCDRVLGPSGTRISSSISDIWLLGRCYKISQIESCTDATDRTGLNAFEIDLSSRILITYRKGFDAIGDSTYTSDVGWGCMLRSSQMLVAQALIFHRLGRSWRKTVDGPLDREYVEILLHFGDSETSSFSIHNLLQAGKPYGLAPGSWVSPYAMCRSWENLARCRLVEANLDEQLLSMAIYIVSGDEDGECGGAPVVCIEDASRHCFEFSKGRLSWTPILLLVPLVLGPGKLNPRYIPSLAATFTFPQSLGILGGKPGASTYIVGTQDEKAFYLDPHDVQQAVHIDRGDLEADTSSYHCSTIRHIPLESIDPSVAIGFYCRNKGDFDDFCSRASKLADKSMGAPLFTVVDARRGSEAAAGEDDSFDMFPPGGEVLQPPHGHEDDWQLL